MSEVDMLRRVGERTLPWRLPIWMFSCGIVLSSSDEVRGEFEYFVMDFCGIDFIQEYMMSICVKCFRHI